MYCAMQVRALLIVERFPKWKRYKRNALCIPKRDTRAHECIRFVSNFAFNLLFVVINRSFGFVISAYLMNISCKRHTNDSCFGSQADDESLLLLIVMYVFFFRLSAEQRNSTHNKETTMSKRNIFFCIGLQRHIQMQDETNSNVLCPVSP